MSVCQRCSQVNTTTHRTCPACLEYYRVWKAANWKKRVLESGRTTDRKKNRYSWEDALTEACLEKMYGDQDGRCHYCFVIMNTARRKIPCGLTLQRLNNSVGHNKGNCVLACHKCNVNRVEKNTKKTRAFVQDRLNQVYWEEIRAEYQLLDLRAPKLK